MGNEYQEIKDDEKTLIAKRDFVIFQNDFRADIKKGDDLSEIPEIYHQNLKTEGVI